MQKITTAAYGAAGAAEFTQNLKSVLQCYILANFSKMPTSVS